MKRRKMLTFMNLTDIPMSELKKYYNQYLNYDNINFSDYFRTLSSEAVYCSLMDRKRFEGIKEQMGNELSVLISDYTGNESTSLMRDTANDIFCSFLYCLDMALFTFGSHENALEYIDQNSVSDVYMLGQRVIKQCVFECVSLLVKARRGRVNFSDKAYNAIFDGEILNYLKRYNPKFFAHGTKRVFSYNTVNGCGGYRGILHLKKYLENLIAENEYVNRFDEDTVQNLCYGYCESNEREYNDLGANIYSIVFLNSVICRLAGKDGLEVKKSDALQVSKMLKKYSEYSQRKMICDAVFEQYNEPYMQKSILKLSGHIINAVENNNLKKIIYIGDLK